MGKSQHRLALAVANAVGLALVVVVNALANALPLGGYTTGQLSDRYPNLFVPAGLTFAIWGPIYVLVTVYAAYGLVTSLGRSETAGSFADRIGGLFLVTCLANAGWIFSWHYRRPVLSLLCMAVLLVALVGIYLRLDVGRSASSAAERYLVHLPMSVYLGWISIATIANVTAVLVAFKWNRFGMSEQFWTVAMLGVGAALALVALFSRNDVFYALVVDWAALGILIKRTQDSAHPAPWVAAASVAALGVLTIGVVVQVARGRVYNGDPRE